MFCTNLTLLTPEIVEYLDNEPAIILGTSIDGDQITNDNNRVYANGKGTYADIVKGLKMFKNKKLVDKVEAVIDDWKKENPILF